LAPSPSSLEEAAVGMAVAATAVVDTWVEAVVVSVGVEAAEAVSVVAP